MIRIMIADDDRDDIEIFSKALKEAAIETDLAVVGDGAALLEKLSDQSFTNPDYLFLDLAMPKQSGFECLNHVRRHGEYDNMKIIILSDSVNVGEIDDAYDLGANYFLTKPTDLTEFSELLSHIFKTDNSTPPSRAEFVLRNYRFKRSPGITF